jgi:hypothetical protein
MTTPHERFWPFGKAADLYTFVQIYMRFIGPLRRVGGPVRPVWIVSFDAFLEKINSHNAE